MRADISVCMHMYLPMRTYSYAQMCTCVNAYISICIYGETCTYALRTRAIYTHRCTYLGVVIYESIKWWRFHQCVSKYAPEVEQTVICIHIHTDIPMPIYPHWYIQISTLSSLNLFESHAQKHVNSLTHSHTHTLTHSYTHTREPAGEPAGNACASLCLQFCESIARLAF